MCTQQTGSKSKKETMIVIHDSWAEHFCKNAPKLMSNLHYKELAIINFYTRIQREPEIKDYRLYFNTFGLVSEYTGYECRYENDNMFEIKIQTREYRDFLFKMRVSEFKTPFDIREESNQLSWSDVQKDGFPVNYPLLNFCRKIIWNWVQECIYTKYAEERSSLIKEELVAKAWAPERVAKWLEAGVNVEDM